MVRSHGRGRSMKRSFREKLIDPEDLPRVQPLTGGMKRRFGPGTILLPAPSEVQALMRKVRKGRLTTINRLRECLARRHGATVACPIVTGIHARIVAGAAGEDEADGKKRVTPYWRTLKTGGELNPKYPGGLAEQRRRLESEGHEVVARGQRLFVRDHEKSLARLEGGNAGARTLTCNIRPWPSSKPASTPSAMRLPTRGHWS
jgi:alkylated DNA nucleotide flippase Atl1